MRNIFALYVLIGVWPNLFAQPLTFNIASDYGYLFYSFEDMVVANDTIVGLGSAYPDSFNLKQGIVLTQLDSNGTLIKTRMYFDSLGRNMAVPPNGRRVIGTTDGGYAFVVSSIPDNDFFLYKVNHNLDIEFIKTYPDTVYTYNYPYRILETKTGYLLSGYNYTVNAQLFGFVRSVDKQGEILWEKKYFQGGKDNYVLDAKAVNDSVLAVVSNVNLDNDQYNIYSIIRVLDIHGNQIGYWEGAVDDEIGAIGELIPLKEGGFITSGHNKYVWQQFNELVQQSFVKFSSDFEVQWIRHWYKPATVSSQRDIRDFLQSADEHIIGVGNGAEGTPGNLKSTANIIKFSVMGDSIWNRIVTRPVPLNSQFAYCNINAGGILSSGSIIAAGQIIQTQDNAYYSWIIKMTTDGCLDTLFSCTTLVKEVGTLPAIGIFPNPAHDWVQIVCRPADAIQVCTINDMQGQKVSQSIIPPASSKIEIHTGDLPNGLYIIQISGKHKKTWGKFAVMH